MDTPNTSPVTLDAFHVLAARSLRRSMAWFAVRRGGVLNTAHYFALLRGDGGALGTAELDMVEGRVLADFIANDAALIIVASSVKSILSESGLTGWREYPVRLYDRKGAAISKEYTGLSIVGRTGCYDRERSVTRWQISKDGCKTVSEMNGIHFDPREWDGSDIFMLTDTDIRFVLATTRLISALKRMCATGWVSCPVLDFKTGADLA